TVVSFDAATQAERQPAAASVSRRGKRRVGAARRAVMLLSLHRFQRTDDRRLRRHHLRAGRAGRRRGHVRGRGVRLRAVVARIQNFLYLADLLRGQVAVHFLGDDILFSIFSIVRGSGGGRGAHGGNIAGRAATFDGRDFIAAVGAIV